MFTCSECGSREYADIEGSGYDVSGEFIDYYCADCDILVRIYDEDSDAQ